LSPSLATLAAALSGLVTLGSASLNFRKLNDYFQGLPCGCYNLVYFYSSRSKEYFGETSFFYEVFVLKTID